MKETLREGLSRTVRIVVDESRTIDFMGDACRVYSTPELVRDIEVNCREMLLEHLDEGEDSVGTRVEIDHTAATLLGMWIDFDLTIAQVQGRTVTFAVNARDPIDDCATGRHSRFVVDIAKTAERLLSKAAKAR